MDVQNIFGNTRMRNNKRVVNPFNRKKRREWATLSVLVSVAILACALILVISAYFTFSMERQPTQSPGRENVIVLPDTSHSHGSSTSGRKSIPETKFDKEATVHRREKSRSEEETWSFTTVQAVRDAFRQRYGPTSASIYEKGVSTFGNLRATADRLLLAAAQDRPFVLAFAGYSVTVGRGNHFQQSFPFVLERILRPLLRESLQLDVVVRNAAIGGIPSFPYGFCFDHFLGSDPDVISWDFSMNEGNGASVLEAYLRHSQTQLSKRPMIILLDKNAPRQRVLEMYTRNEWISDAISVKTAKDAVDSTLLQLPEDQRPPGLQRWDEFGAPASCPGRGSWHPKRMEHELIGFMMSLYFVDALELAQRIMQENPEWKASYESNSMITPRFKAPLQPTPANDQAVTELLFGHSIDQDDFQMKTISCRTNFLPATDGNKVLPSIVVSGLSPGITDENIMEVRSDAAYRAGWVLDVSKMERDTKIKVEKCGGLGYIDMKIALYGVPESGPLRLWLPLGDHDSLSHHNSHEHEEGDTIANHWFDDLIICEANEKRPIDACQLDKDLEFTVGGVLVTSTKMVMGAAEYLKRQTCVHVGVPEKAQITVLGEVTNTDGSLPSDTDRIRLAGGSKRGNSTIGLLVDVKVSDRVNRESGACCLSHIVWEQH
jgi:CheY-like chemotaxis protein